MKQFHGMFLVLCLVACNGSDRNVGTLVAGESGVALDSDGDTVKIQVFAHLANWLSRESEGRYTVTPLRGAYDSSDPATIVAINAELENAGIVPLVSWWGPHDKAGDQFLDVFLSIPSSLKIGLLYEVSGRLHKNPEERYDFNDPRNVQIFQDDIRHLYERYWARPEYRHRFHTVNGKPVLFIWLSQAFVGDFENVSARTPYRDALYLIGSNFNLFESVPRDGDTSVIGGLDAVSSYGTSIWQLADYLGVVPDPEGKYHVTTQYVDQYLKSAFRWSSWLETNAPKIKLILPMGFAYADGRPGNIPMTSTREEAEHFASEVQKMIMLSVLDQKNILPFVLVVSYNEHYEGSSIEPTREYGNTFIRIIQTFFKEPISADSFRLPPIPEPIPGR